MTFSGVDPPTHLYTYSGLSTMTLVTSSIFLDIFLALFPILYFVYWYITYNDDYWDNRGIPNDKSRRNLIKNLLGMQSQHDIVSEMYNRFYGRKLVGSLQVNKPVLMVRDPDLIQKVLIKDFVHFQDRGGLRSSSKDPLSINLFGLRGQIWRALRYKLTPTFTTGKLRIMLEQVSKSGDNLMEKLHSLSNKGKSFESKEVMYEFTLDVISSCAFGIQLKPNSPEFYTFKSSVQKMFSVSFISILRSLITTTMPKFADLINLTAFPKDASEYFLNFTKATIKYRIESKIQRNDYLQLLLTLKEQEDSGKEMISSLSDATEYDAVIDQMRYTEQNGEPTTVNRKLMTEDAICANSFIFLTAGSESTANTISFTLLNLTQHPEVQQRVQREVDSVLKQHGGWNYDAIRDLTYMDQVIQETQRMNPLLPMLFRECVLPYKVPGTDLVIEKGVMISIPIMGLHMDPQYYPEPERFNPDRFEGNNFKPNPTFLPFGDGPRICIAMRFAVMEVKICLARIMSEYTVCLSPKTKTPIQMKKRGFFPEVEGGIWLTLTRRKTSM